jgi:hypothetical protein
MSEIPDVDEEKLKVAGDAFSIPTMIVNKGDNVTVHFYNVDPVPVERHSFTIGAPYNVDADIAFGESDVVNFMADIGLLVVPSLKFLRISVSSDKGVYSSAYDNRPGCMTSR